MNEDRFSPAAEILSGATADLYFLHAREILKKEGINPQVTIEIFPSGGGILCGMKEVESLLKKVLPPRATAWGLDEGEEMSEGEIALRINSPYRSVGIYETAILGILAQESGWATAARACVIAAGETPVIHFGARHVHPAVAPRLEYAAIVGGCTSCATPAGASLAGLEPTGTIPHALILCMGDTVKAMQSFDRNIGPENKRIALVDTFKDEAEESLRVARALGPRLWGVRLDTPAERGRVTPALAKEVRARLDQAGFDHVRIVASGGIDSARITLFKEERAPVDAFGVGSAISSASPIDFTADIKQVDGDPVAKRGRIPGTTHNPRLKRFI
ncbi:MAG: nicotinate phosphoribosyltransferase [Candidatus Bipolaricaulota bacterium]|nr:nicotinate phosphoribosyltransferase [Candidatus Bipolaricaulota bacterium]